MPAPRAGEDLIVSERVAIELTRAQVLEVVRGASSGVHSRTLLSQLSEQLRSASAHPGSLGDSRLSRSLLSGLMVLAAFPSDGSYASNAEIAQLLGLARPTTHLYITTLLEVGLVERDTKTRRYRRANRPGRADAI
jgi:Fic family protein